MNAIKLLFIFFRQRHYRNEIRIAKCGKHLILKLKNIIQIHSKVATKVWILESILDLSQRIGVVSPLVSLTFWVISSKSLPSSGWHSPSKFQLPHCIVYMLKRAELREAASSYLSAIHTSLAALRSSPAAIFCLFYNLLNLC